ncbi:MAG: hypothetical protein NZ651_05035 [Candidatus Bipolaricaulota bacterium]|nr:hypothetical protein [Candidatus Bipolaricaulota bacterium]MDW8127118.1 hypothetical protein [Candidatus Bipolaricaulota bacterium]
MKTYLMREDWTYKWDYEGNNTFQPIAAYVGKRETVLNIDPTRFGVFALLAHQSGTAQNRVVSLPYGIALPQSSLFSAYVQAVGTVGGVRRELTITAVDPVAGTITVAENVPNGSIVDVYCVPAHRSILVELRIEPPNMGVRLQRTIWVADVSTLIQRDWWKTGLVFPAAYPLPEDWVLSLWVRSALPIYWRVLGTNIEIRHPIVIPVEVTTKQGRQEAVKAGLLAELTQ